MSSLFNIVLVHPVIPQNTGNIARLTAATNTLLHLVKPLGFELTDRYLKRAGLDYWPAVQLVVHENWQEFLEETSAKESNLYFYSTHATKSYLKAKYSAGDYLVFGSETKGLSEEMHEKYAERRFKIPFECDAVRSLNLANAAAIVLFEARRQCGVG